MESAVYESGVQMAIRQAKHGIERSLNAAADANGVARSTVKHRAAGRLERNPWGRTLLHKYQEEQIREWITELEKWGFPMRVNMLPQVVNSIASFPPGQKEVGKNWVTRFIKRNGLHSILSRNLDSQRAFNNDPDVIQDWFAFYRVISKRYKIRQRNMYNFDEKGVLFGISANSRVILTSKDYRTLAIRKSVQQPGSRESVSLIESFCADGSALPPLVIWKGKQHQSNWYKTDDKGDRKGWTYAFSDNGWTDNDLGYEYIQAFDRATASKSPANEHRLVIMDNHGSHVTWRFIKFALERRIVLVCLPPHSTHLLQPCDVGLFQPLQAAYGRQVDNHCRAGHTGVNKESFLKLYSEARKIAFTKDNILAAWRGTGLAPYNPNAVLKRLPTWEKTGDEKATVSSSSGRGSGPGQELQCPKTPKTVQEIEELFADIQNSRTERLDGLLESPIKCMLEKLCKSAIKGRAEADIHRETNKTFEAFGGRKKGGKKAISKARVLTQDDVDRLIEEEEGRNAEVSEKTARRAYVEGQDLPEDEVAGYSHAVLNPGEANQLWASQAMVFRCNAQPVGDGDIGLPAWNGRSAVFGGVGVKLGDFMSTQPKNKGKNKTKK
jgi:DDE superfamily endonuclease/Tc5 transposase-like DNA-binding protein